MTSKRQKKIAKRIARAHEAAVNEGVVEEPYRPKTGPGQVFTRELIDAQSGHAKRTRNVGCSALMLAFHRGQLECVDDAKKSPAERVTAQERFEAGERIEKWWYAMNRSVSRDSTDPLVGTGTGENYSDARQHASEALSFLRSKMAPKNYSIIMAFCGEGYSMAESLRMAGVRTAIDGTTFRIREALDDLVYALTNRSWIVYPKEFPAKHSVSAQTGTRMAKGA